ncbi:hypothetical protein WN943_000573 [Citrus x changshan-huyou]
MRSNLNWFSTVFTAASIMSPLRNGLIPDSELKVDLNLLRKFEHSVIMKSIRLMVNVQTLKSSSSNELEEQQQQQ